MRTDAINGFASSELCRSLQDGGKTPLTSVSAMPLHFTGNLRVTVLDETNRLTAPWSPPAAQGDYAHGHKFSRVLGDDSRAR
jgi:hypothetical protein